MEYLATATSYFPHVIKYQFGFIGLAFLTNPLHNGPQGAMAS